MTDQYDSDVVVWAEQQAAHIRARRFDLLGLEHLADEIEDVGKTEKREFASRMSVLLVHWLKWTYQSDRCSGSWERTLREQRKRAVRKLKEVPSLQPLLLDAEWIEDVWGDAVTEAAKDTSLDVFPESCPWFLPDVLREEWHPA